MLPIQGRSSSFSKTQGGADACPGLLDVAPSGLNLVPFGSKEQIYLLTKMFPMQVGSPNFVPLGESM